MVLPWPFSFHNLSHLVSITSGGDISLFSTVYAITVIPVVRLDYINWLIGLEKPMF